MNDEPGTQRAAEAAQARILERRQIRLPGWRLAQTGVDGQKWIHEPPPRTSLIWSVGEYAGRLWLHISISSPDRRPRWDELVAAKEWIAGVDAYAYQVIPPRRHYVNIDDNAIHAWSPLEGDPPLPEFSMGRGSI
jgi:hypothetical protein